MVTRAAYDQLFDEAERANKAVVQLRADIERKDRALRRARADMADPEADTETLRVIAEIDAALGDG